MADRLILVAAGLLALSGAPGLFVDRRSMSGQWIATILAVLGAAIGLAGSLAIASAGESIERSILWSVLGQELLLRIDGVAVVFLLPVFLMAGMGSIFGMGYWAQTEHAANGRKLRLFYGLLPASMVLVIVAQDAILFLFAWEVMALSAFFLVTTEDEEARVRRAGWIYLVATHIGTLVLFALFATIRHFTGSFALAPIAEDSIGLGTATVVFVLALIGFGLKAGVMPLHVWLPSAHANAPSHVSAVLSGVLLKIGIYGLVRVCGLLPNPPASWGVALLALGAISAVIGVAFALAQHDLKRLLAYHSIENIGIIVMGLGLAMIGRSMDRPEWIVLGLAGALLHVWNHALFKSLLFFGAGSVIKVMGTHEIDRMGGLARGMPQTALLFTVGAVAICGLPPLNGFVSEFLVYLGLFSTVGIGGGPSLMGAALGAPILAITGALALACFVKVVGAVFLGSPRTIPQNPVRESPASMLVPMFVLAACCLGLGLAPMLAAPLLQHAIGDWAGSAGATLPSLSSLAPLGWVSVINVGLIIISVVVFIGVIGLARRGAVSGVDERRVGTWDCGFAYPAPAAPRVQYTASSFAQMLVGMLSFVLRPREHRPHLHAQFPHAVGFKSHVDDVVLEGWILPAMRGIERWFLRLRVLQHGRVQLYVLYVLVVLILMFLVTFPVYELVLRLISR